MGQEGGHKLYEPICFETAPVYSPHVKNFADAYVALQQAGAAEKVGDTAQVGPSITHLLRDDVYLIVTGSSVNQRSGPSTSNAVMGQLIEGTRVRRLNERNGWTQISSELGTGWMSSRYLQPQRSRNANAESVRANRYSLSSSAIRVIDGDTIGVQGQSANVRLVGFNAPETSSPQCQAELNAGRRATARLNALVSNAQSIELERVRCACQPGTEGTSRCNFGRQCGALRVNGADVGHILISESLAVPYICGRTSCPPRPGNWCR